MGWGGGGQGHAGGIVTKPGIIHRALFLVRVGALQRPRAAEPGTPAAWGVWQVGGGGGNGTEEDVLPLQEEGTGHLGLLREEAGSASGQTGPSKGRKEEANGVLPIPSQTTGD